MSSAWGDGNLVTFLGRPALSLTLGAGHGQGHSATAADGDGSAKPSSGGGDGAQPPLKKRSQGAVNGGGDADETPGSAKQVVRAMLRAHKLGVLVPLVYHCDTATGRATLESVPGQSLGALLRAAAAAPAPAHTAASQAPPAPAPPPQAAAGDVLPAALAAAAAGLGRCLARLHDGGQVLGGLSDLEAVVVREGEGAVFLTDFRRSTNTMIAADKAEDLLRLEATLAAAGAAAETKAETKAVKMSGARTVTPQGRDVRGGSALAAAVFYEVLAVYKASSRFWSATHNKLGEARARRATSASPEEGPQAKRVKAAPPPAAQKDPGTAN